MLLIVDIFPVAFAYILTVGLKIIGGSQKILMVEVGSKNISTSGLMIGCKKAVLHPRVKVEIKNFFQCQKVYYPKFRPHTLCLIKVIKKQNQG